MNEIQAIRRNDQRRCRAEIRRLNRKMQAGFKRIRALRRELGHTDNLS